MQIDFTKHRPRHVLIWQNPEGDTIGFCQPLEYENGSPYCEYCKHQGYDTDTCISNWGMKSTDKGNKKRGEKQQKTNTNKSKEQEDTHKKSKENREQQQLQGTYNNMQRHQEHHKKEQWKTQKKEKHKKTGARNLKECMETYCHKLD